MALFALVVLVPTIFTLGLHSGVDSVASPTLEPTTLYKSEHSGPDNEIHLHADVGFESYFCLACFTSLRNQSLLAGEPPFVASSPIGAFSAIPSGLAPALALARTVSSRAPPRA